MLSMRVIALGASLLFHSVAGVTYWEWNLHHPAASGKLAGVQPTELAIVLVPEESAAPAAKMGEVIKPEIATPAPAASPQPDLSSLPKPVEEQVLAQAPLVPVPVATSDSGLVVPAPVDPHPAVASILNSVKAYGDASASGAETRSGISAGGESGSAINFAGYRRNPPPTYPALAQTHRWEGTVLLSVRISPDGTAAEVTVKESSGYVVLDEAAVAAVRNWEFEPARVNQQSIGSTAEVPVHFQLRAAGTR